MEFHPNKCSIFTVHKRRKTTSYHCTSTNSMAKCFDSKHAKYRGGHNSVRHKTHKRLKEHFFIRWNRTKHANFWCNHLFRATYNTTENSDANLFLAVRCQEAGGMKARKRWLRQKFACFVLFHLIKKCSFNLFCVLDLFILVWRW